MNAEKIADIALTVGEILLTNGAENHRIEECITRICNSYQANVEILLTSNGLLLLVEDLNSNKFTSIKKVKEKGVDLYRIELINSFSRSLEKKPISYEEAKKQLNDIKKAPIFSFNVRTFAACMTGFIYTLFFNGSILDGLVSIPVCLITYYIFEKISTLNLFQFLNYYLSGLLIGSLSLLSNLIFPVIDSNNVITGSIMILLPGVVLTNSIKDIIYGDYSSGTSKFFEAMLIITAVGCGVVTTLFFGL